MLAGRGGEQLDGGLVGGLDVRLAPALVDEVDEVGFAVEADVLAEMLSRGGERVVDALYLQRGRELERVELGPVDGDGAAGLDVREDLRLLAVEAALCVGGGEVLGGEAVTPETPGGVTEDDDLLGFVEVAGIAGDV